MTKVVALVLFLLPCPSIATAQCEVFDYPDHYEAVCIGGAEQAPAGQIPRQGRVPGQNRQVASVQADAESPDVAPEKIVRNELARLHGAVWLKTRPGG